MEKNKNNIKILTDYGFFRWQKMGGISRYHYELIKGLKSKGYKIDIGVKFNKNYYLEEILGKVLYISKIKSLDIFLNAFNKLYNIYLLKKNKYSYFHPSSNSEYYLNYLEETKLIVTIHDMIDEKLESIFLSEVKNKIEYYQKIGKIWDYKKNIEARKKNIFLSKKIIAISKNTKKDILELYPEIDPDKIEVIYHGNSLEKYKLENYSNRKEDKKYILYVGARNFLHKNFENFIYGISRILLEKDMYLICIGGGKFSPEENIMLKKLEINERVFQENVNDDKLIEAYKGAEIFVSPSLYEGFGMPLVEAMYCNCPMAISNTSCYPEIAEEGAIYFNPYNRDEIYEQCKKLIENQELRKRIKINQKERIKFFNWEETVEKTLQVYLKA